MIRVDNMMEVSESKSDNSKGYLNIKPIENFSDQEMTDFIAKEFEKAHDEAEIDIYDKLLSEVFNCSEEELDINFNIDDKVRAVLVKFKMENWNVMDATDQLTTIKELIDIVGEKLGLDKIPEVLISNDIGAEYGFYDPKKEVISLNRIFLNNPIELVDTVAHELRHAYQYVRAEMLETKEDVLYKVNFDNYISPLPLPAGGYLFFTDYQDQYVEVDARVFANLFTEAMK